MYDENVPAAIAASKELPKELGVNGLSPKPLPLEVRFQDASFKWLDDHPDPHLRNLTLTVPPGSLLAVIGPVGAGKVRLLAIRERFKAARDSAT